MVQLSLLDRGTPHVLLCNPRFLRSRVKSLDAENPHPRFRRHQPALRARARGHETMTNSPDPGSSALSFPAHHHSSRPSSEPAREVWHSVLRRYPRSGRAGGPCWLVRLPDVVDARRLVQHLRLERCSEVRGASGPGRLCPQPRSPGRAEPVVGPVLESETARAGAIHPGRRDRPRAGCPGPTRLRVSGDPEPRLALLASTGAGSPPGLCGDPGTCTLSRASWRIVPA